MKLPHRRRFLHLAVGAAALPAVSRIARAQAYPSRPVRIIVGFSAGGTTDIGARLIAQWLSERLGQPFIIENRPGAGTHTATEPVVSVIRSPFVLEVYPAVPVKTVPELIAYAKANRGKINMASFGTGSASHLSGEMFKTITGIEMVHVPYRGSAPMLIDLLS